MKEFLEKASHAPKYLRLADHFREQIDSGVLKPGDRLPSFAQMQAQHGVGQATLERAYALLQDQRVIVREANRGIFVAESRIPAALGVVGVTSGRRPKDYPYY